ncbi:MAG: hypothetical protein KUL77_01955 [Thermomonas sp.]|uniref:sirohydrochlorin chelatase n=1 Tax=Thermomonas sp. TaxID=1971895 RepID=UPI001EBA2D16|nr:hypothetical protein [Thermomonas sp.]MBV2208311.1 hypothetical protein [Thermomonas sp.]
MSHRFARRFSLRWSPLLAALALACSPLVATAQHAGHDHMQHAAESPAKNIGKDKFGVLVMAHGGIPQWEKEVTETLAPLRSQYPMEIAFGMADAVSLQQGVAALEAQGVEKIGVVRLFISGESWYDRTLQILGVEPGAPVRPPQDPHAGHGEHAGHSMEFWKITSKAKFKMSHDGLLDSPEMGEVLAARARELSKAPKKEDVLILAHGPGDDAENARWLEKMGERAATVQKSQPFRRVQVMTLREDWPEKREAATRAVRDYVQRAVNEGGTAIVIPYRVQGFGPYAKTLDGLTYVSDSKGLTPHPQVAAWVQREADVLRTELKD